MIVSAHKLLQLVFQAYGRVIFSGNILALNIQKTGKFLVLMVLFFSGQSIAQHHEPLLNFKFKHRTNIKIAEYSSIFDINAHTSTIRPLSNENSLQFSQYDATWTYPLRTKDMNFDLGLTLRHLAGLKNTAKGLNTPHFQQTLPLLHASALFNLPLKGLSAGIEGSHLDSKDTQIFDYRAKVSYEWRSGFGMQGGWQHQQFSLDNVTDTGADYELNGPFIDFYLNF